MSIPGGIGPPAPLERAHLALPPRWPRQQARARPRGARSVKLAGIRRREREARDDVEFLEQTREDVVDIVAGTELIELRHQPHEALLGLGDGAVRKVFTLLLEAVAVFEKFLS